MNIQAYLHLIAFAVEQLTCPDRNSTNVQTSHNRKLAICQACGCEWEI